MKNIVYFIIFVLLFSLTAQAVELTNQEKEFVTNNPKVKIALMPDFSPFSYIKDDRVIGFENDLLEIISQSTGIKFEKRFSVWNKNLKAFEEKKVDMISSISYKKEREAFTTFTTPYYTIPIMIFVRDDFGTYEGIQSLEGKKVGILKDIFYSKELKKHINNDLHIFETYEEVTEALVFGKIDALIQNLPNINYLIKKNLYSNLVLADELQLPGIKKEDLRFGINPNKPLLYNIIQKALDSIDEKTWETLSEKWLSVKLIDSQFSSQTNNTSIPLTPKEKTYLQNTTVKIGMINDYYPFSYKEKNNLNGFSYEYFKLLASKVDMKFDVQIDNWSPTLEKFKNKKIDIIDAISYSKDRKKFANFSDPYFEIPNVIFARKNSFENYTDLESLKNKRVGITKNIYYFDIIKNLKLFDLIVFESSREKIKALALGKIDAALNNLTSGQKYIVQGGYTNIQVLDELDTNIVKKEDLRLGISKNNLLLHSIIKKATNAISTNEKLTLISKYFGVSLQDAHNKQDLNLPNTIKLTEEEKSFVKSNPVIRVHNETNWPPYNFNQNGEPLGYSIDTINLIAKKTGLQIDYITGPTWNEFLNMMKDGSLDVLLNAVQTPERLKYLLYTNPYADNPNTILSKINKPYKDIKSLFGKTVAIPKGFFTEEILKKDYPQINLLLVKNTLETMKAVIFGKADAAFGELAVFDYLMNEQMISGLSVSGEANIGDSDFSLLHIAIRKDLPILASILKKGVDSISIEEKRKMQKKWFEKSEIKEIKFSLNEREYLAKKQEIKMCVIPDILPLEQIDKKGQHQGIAKDIIEIISKKIKTPIVLVPTNSWAQSLKNIENKKCDILPAAMSTQTRQKYMNFTTPYIFEPLVIATTNDKFFIENSSELKNRKIGVLESHIFIELLKEKNPEIEIVQVANPKIGLKQVQDGKLFGYVDILPSIAYTIQKEGMIDLKVAGKLEFDAKFSVASRNDELFLNSIIQKALNDIGEEELRSIVGKWVSIKVEQSFNYTKLIYVSLFFLVLLSVVLYKNRSIKALNKKLKELSVTDNLTTLFNRNKIEEVLEKEADRSNRFLNTFAVIMVDIDYFKKVNDTYGHQMGDTILKEFANILQSNSRKTDIVGRWGGEEFIIICSQTDLKGAINLANTMREKIANYPFSLAEQKTASFGVALYKNNENTTDLIKRADDALYKAKENGRNKVEVIY